MQGCRPWSAEKMYEGRTEALQSIIRSQSTLHNSTRSTPTWINHMTIEESNLDNTHSKGYEGQGINNCREHLQNISATLTTVMFTFSQIWSTNMNATFWNSSCFSFVYFNYRFVWNKHYFTIQENIEKLLCKLMFTICCESFSRKTNLLM